MNGEEIKRHYSTYGWDADRTTILQPLSGKYVNCPDPNV